jgi:hypothetical protein
MPSVLIVDVVLKGLRHPTADLFNNIKGPRDVVGSAFDARGRSFLHPLARERDPNLGLQQPAGFSRRFGKKRYRCPSDH